MNAQQKQLTIMILTPPRLVDLYRLYDAYHQLGAEEMLHDIRQEMKRVWRGVRVRGTGVKWKEIRGFCLREGLKFREPDPEGVPY